MTVTPAMLRDRALSGAARALEFHCIRTVARAAADMHGLLGFVGGSVRDWMMQSKGPDIDLLWTGNLDALATALRDLGAEPRLRPAYRTLSFPCGGIVIDVAAPRQDRYPVPGGVPEVAPADLLSDARRRDFTANAMTVFMAETDGYELFDPLNGLDDVAAGALRPTRPETLGEDPVRVLRGARYLTRFQWRPVGDWDAAWHVVGRADGWAHVAVGRIWREAAVIADEDQAAAVWELLCRWGVDVALFGEPLPEQALVAMDHWRSRWGPERIGTGRNWLIDATVLEHVCPGLWHRAAALWQPAPSDWNRWQRFHRRVRAAEPVAAPRDAIAKAAAQLRS